MRPTRPELGFLAALVALGAIACAAVRSEPDRSSPEAAAAGVVEAMARRDFETIAAFAHPRDGVRFSPYAHVDPASDQVLSSERIAGAASDAEILEWGLQDATGEPIRMRIVDYWARFVYDVDFANASEIQGDRWYGRGNSLDNSREVYPEERSVDYYFPGFEPGLEGLDWRSLRLVLREHGGEWYLVGVIHDEWTI